MSKESLAQIDAGSVQKFAIRPQTLVSSAPLFRGPDGELIELVENKTGYT